MITTITWVLITLSTGKFSESLHVEGYPSQIECVAHAKTSHSEEWACFPVSLPEGVEFRATNKPFEFSDEGF